MTPQPAALIHVELPFHLRTLAQIDQRAQPLLLAVPAPLTLDAVLAALEARFPMLRGTIRDQVTLERRPFLRFFAGQSDISHQPPDTPLPPSVAQGAEPLTILGAIAGGSR